MLKHRVDAMASVAMLCCTIAAAPSFAGQLTMVPFGAIGNPPHRLSVEENLTRLSNYDVVLIVDKSSSMQVSDCVATVDADADPDQFKTVSRWQWCSKQLHQLAEKSSKIIPEGIRLVLFSDDYSVYDNVSPAQVAQAFSEHKPSGMTQATRAIRSQLQQYFKNKAQHGENTRPMVIAVITDGGLDVPLPLRHAILEASKQMDRPGEISITFLQVGHDKRSRHLAEKLNCKSTGTEANGTYNIVQVRDFNELRRVGLPQALVEATLRQTY